MLTMTPPPWAIICLPAHLQPRKTPFRLMPTTVFQPLIEMSSGFARKEAPALFTMTSSRRHSSAARSTMALTWSSCRTSTAIANERRPRSRMAFTTGSRCSSLREQMATSAPAFANSIAMDFPMPVPPPVTIAVLPSRENGFLAMAGTIPQRAGDVYGPGGAGAGGSILGGEILQKARVVPDGRRAPLERDPPAIEHVGVLGDAQGKLQVLLDQHDRHLLHESPQALRDLFDDADPDALGRLVEQQELGPGQERAADRQHLALAAAQRRCRLTEPLAQLRKERQH